MIKEKMPPKQINLQFLLSTQQVRDKYPHKDRLKGAYYDLYTISNEYN